MATSVTQIYYPQHIRKFEWHNNNNQKLITTETHRQNGYEKGRIIFTGKMDFFL